MAKRRRSTLKNLFRQGALPSADHFGDFIDSSVNQVDDGFDKSPENGLEISSLGNNHSLVSFFRKNLSERALWTIGYDETDESGNTILFTKLDDQGKPKHHALSLSPDGRVGIHRKDPKYHLDVDGTVRSKGRIGVATGGLKVPADGDWHDITETLTGCNALEVIAGVGGKKGSGRYALVHAIALNAYNPTGLLSKFFKRKNRIKCQNAYYNARGDRLQLQWEGKGREYKLQLRSRCDYGGNTVVRYYVTELWDDAEMAGSRPENADNSGQSDVSDD